MVGKGSSMACVLDALISAARRSMSHLPVQLVEAIASSAGLQRSDFNVVRVPRRVFLRMFTHLFLPQRASPKGLFSSSAVTILLQTGVSIESVDGQVRLPLSAPRESRQRSSLKATLVPYGDLIESVQLKEDVDALDWVVIVEKDVSAILSWRSSIV